MQVLKSAILAIFQTGLLVQPSKIPHRISKILFALGADEFLAMLEGKIREALFFKVQSGKITVCWRFLISNKLEQLKFTKTIFSLVTKYYF